MMGLRQRQGNLRLVSRLFKSYARPPCLCLNPIIDRLNNLKTSLRFPCLGLNPIIDSIILVIIRSGVLPINMTSVQKRQYRY